MNRNEKFELVYVWGEILLRNMVLHTTRLLRHYVSQENVKKAKKFCKGHSKDHSSISSKKNLKIKKNH
jgi:hypothetical protein